MLAFLKRIFGNAVLTGRQRRMRVCETLSLGEKRFLAIVQVDDQQLLIGNGGISLFRLQEPAATLPGAEKLPFVVNALQDKGMLDAS
jgi:flagellar biogenesis protein FliO